MDRIDKFLQDRKDEGLYRVLRPAESRKPGVIVVDGRKLADFSSNDYLGLSNHRRLKKASRKATKRFGTSSSASRLLSGDLHLHHELEKKTAEFKGKESALVFNSGYQANVGIISALYGKDDAIFCDRLCHASILDGVQLSGAKLFRFGHNGIEHLEYHLKKTEGQFVHRLIVTESVFSMDGDKAPLKELVDIKKKYGCQLFVDEAHATGIFGENGSGLVEEYGLSQHVEFIMGTFSKAMGGFGAYLACDERIKNYLINTCRSFIYSTSLPPAVIATNIEALKIIKNEPKRRKRLLSNADFFRHRLRKKGLDVRGSSQIVPLVVGDSQKAVALSDKLQLGGFRVLAIRPPTVAAGQARLRFSLSFGHSRGVLKSVAKRVVELMKE